MTATDAQIPDREEKYFYSRQPFYELLFFKMMDDIVPDVQVDCGIQLFAIELL